MALQPVDLKQDLDFLFTTLERTHPRLYAYTDKAGFEKVRSALCARAERAMDRKQFYWLLAPVVAGLKSGHTCVLPPEDELVKSLAAGGKLHALTLDCVSEPPILLGYAGAKGLPVGGAVLSIHHEDTAKIVARYAACMPSEGKAFNRPILAKALPFFLWMEYGTEGPLVMRIRAADGTTADWSIEPVTMKEAGESGTWKASGVDYVYRYLERDAAAVIEWNSFADRGAFGEFLASTFRDIQQKKLASLVIDLRGNPGGDSHLGRDMMDYLYDKPYYEFSRVDFKMSPLLRQQQPGLVDHAKALGKGREPGDGQVFSAGLEERLPSDNLLRYSGKVYVLVGPRTASSAVIFAATAKQYRVATLIGTETCDTTDCYGDALSFELPRSGLRCMVACKHFVYAGSKEHLRGVLPDHEVRQTPGDAASGLDTVMRYSLGLAKK